MQHYWGVYMKPGLLTLISGCALLIPASLGLLIAGVPTVMGPFPAITAVPAFISSRAVAVVVPTLFFCVESRPVSGGK